MFLLALFALLFTILEALLFFSPRGLPLPALLYGALQGLFQAYLFAWVCQKVQTKRSARLLLIGFFFLLFLEAVHIFLVRTMDAPIGYLLQYFFAGSFSHFLAAIEAVHFPRETWGLFAAILCGTCLSAAALERTRTWGRLSGKPLFFLLALLAVGEVVSASFLEKKEHERLAASLPLPLTLFHPKARLCAVQPRLAQAKNPLSLPLLDETPNLYFFIVESLRNDCVNEEIAPALFEFGETHLRCKRTFANANGTHLSWFSLLNSRYPCHWLDVPSEAACVKGLKQLGYQIRVYTSSDLSYYGMREKLFGKEPLHCDVSHLPLAPWEKDALLFQTALSDASEKKRGIAHFFFLESTHSEYSFPPSFATRFTPIASQINYLGLSRSEGEKIRNRYKTAIAYVDSLFAQFFAELEEKGLFEESLIAITGDHGEEFFDDGALFHGSHLNLAQTAVPILLKVGGVKKTELATHIDIFPTLFHALTKKSAPFPFLEGRSLLVPREKEERIAMQNNGPGRPFEFLLEKEGKELLLRLPQNLSPSLALEAEVLQGEAPEPLSLPF